MKARLYLNPTFPCHPLHCILQLPEFKSIHYRQTRIFSRILSRWTVARAVCLFKWSRTFTPRRTRPPLTSAQSLCLPPVMLNTSVWGWLGQSFKKENNPRDSWEHSSPDSHGHLLCCWRVDGHDAITCGFSWRNRSPARWTQVEIHKLKLKLQDNMN